MYAILRSVLIDKYFSSCSLIFLLLCMLDMFYVNFTLLGGGYFCIFLYILDLCYRNLVNVIAVKWLNYLVNLLIIWSLAFLTCFMGPSAAFILGLIFYYWGNFLVYSLSDAPWIITAVVAKNRIYCLVGVP